MTTRERALVKDESTGDRPYFILVEREGGSSSSGDIRFNHRSNADLFAMALNEAYKREGRLWDGNREQDWECTCQ